jgi:hypothetical protein
MPIRDWSNKDDVIKEAAKVPYRVKPQQPATTYP